MKTIRFSLPATLLALIAGCSSGPQPRVANTTAPSHAAKNDASPEAAPSATAAPAAQKSPSAPSAPATASNLHELVAMSSAWQLTLDTGCIFAGKHHQIDNVRCETMAGPLTLAAEAGATVVAALKNCHVDAAAVPVGGRPTTITTQQNDLVSTGVVACSAAATATFAEVIYNQAIATREQGYPQHACGKGKVLIDYNGCPTPAQGGLPTAACGAPKATCAAPLAKGASCKWNASCASGRCGLASSRCE